MVEAGVRHGSPPSKGGEKGHTRINRSSVLKFLKYLYVSRSSNVYRMQFAQDWRWEGRGHGEQGQERASVPSRSGEGKATRCWTHGEKESAAERERQKNRA